MGLTLHCHRELKLTKVRMEEKGDTKRKNELLPQALADLLALQNVFFTPPHVQRCLPLEQSRRNRLSLPHQHRRRSTPPLQRSMRPPQRLVP